MMRRRSAATLAAAFRLPLAATLSITACGENGFVTRPPVDTTASPEPTTGKDTTPPLVLSRVTEVVAPGAQVVVSASDARGVKMLGLAQFTQAGVLIRRDSVIRTDSLKTGDVASFPVAVEQVALGRKLVLLGFARDSSGNLGYPAPAGANRSDTSTALKTTVERGVGLAVELGNGTEVTQFLFHPRRGELYAINKGLNRLERIDVARNQRTAVYSTGTLPIQGQFLPRNSTGALRDTLVIANRGSAFLSIFDLAQPTPIPSPRPLDEVRVFTKRRVISEDGDTTFPSGTIDRRQFTGDRATGLALLCETAVRPGPCTRVIAYVGTGGPTVRDSNVTLVRTVPLTGPSATQGVLLQHIHDPNGRDVELATLRTTNLGTGATTSLYSEYPTYRFGGLFGGRWALTNRRDGRTIAGINRVQLVQGRAFRSQLPNRVVSTLSTADIASNVSGTTDAIVARPWSGNETRFAVRTDQQIAFVDSLLRLRGSVALPSGGFTFVDPTNVDPAVGPVRWGVSSRTGAQPSLTISTTEFDGLRALFTVRTSVPLQAPLTAWLNTQADTLFVVGTHPTGFVSATLPLGNMAPRAATSLGQAWLQRAKIRRDTP